MPATIFLLFILTGLVNPLLKRLHPRASLRRPELVVGPQSPIRTSLSCSADSYSPSIIFCTIRPCSPGDRVSAP